MGRRSLSISRISSNGLVVGIAADVASERPWPHKLEELLLLGDER